MCITGRASAFHCGVSEPPTAMKPATRGRSTRSSSRNGTAGSSPASRIASSLSTIARSALGPSSRSTSTLSRPGHGAADDRRRDDQAVGLHQPLPEPPGVVGISPGRVRWAGRRSSSRTSSTSAPAASRRAQRLLEHDLGAAAGLAGAESEQSCVIACLSFGHGGQPAIGRTRSVPSQPSARAVSRGVHAEDRWRRRGGPRWGAGTAGRRRARRRCTAPSDAVWISGQPSALQPVGLRREVVDHPADVADARRSGCRTPPRVSGCDRVHLGRARARSVPTP